MKKIHYVGLLVATLVSQVSYGAMTGHPVEATTTLEVTPPPVAFSHVLVPDTVLNEGAVYDASTVIARGTVSSSTQFNKVSLKWNRSVNPEDTANNQPQRALISGEQGGMSPVAVEFTAVQSFTPGDDDNVVFDLSQQLPQFDYGVKLSNDKNKIKAGTYKLAVYADISVA